MDDTRQKQIEAVRRYVESLRADAELSRLATRGALEELHEKRAGNARDVLGLANRAAKLAAAWVKDEQTIADTARLPADELMRRVQGRING